MNHNHSHNASSTFTVPASSNTVSVRIIDTTSSIHVPMPPFMPPTVPSYAFLITHPSGRNLLFDLGLRTDWQNLSPVITSWIKAVGARVSAEKSVPQILTENGVELDNIEGIIWSHAHFDHTGNPSLFPTSTSLLVGPGFKKTFLPGYPSSKYSAVLEPDFSNRAVHELDFTTTPLTVGRFDAIDYFADGSFYILDAPGHSAGHIAALARVSASPDSFILMAGDACYHPGELRPSKAVPLPESIVPHPFHPGSSDPCPGALFRHMLRDDDANKAFLPAAKQTSVGSDQARVEETLEKLAEADGDERVLVVLAHDESVKDVVDLFPADASGWKMKGWKERARWAFLRESGDEVGRGRL